ncbi:MAG: FAD binding domain-containing protein [Bacteroidales bacterium]
MRTATSSLRLLEPRSLEDAVKILRDEERLVPMAGCTDIYVSLNSGALAGVHFLDVWPLDALRGISARRARLSIGALSTYTELQRSPVVRRRVPMLSAAAAQVGGRQVQNRGTIGGNIGNASPAGDVLPVLAAADAVVVLRSVDEERRVPINAYFTGYRESVRRRDELIVAIEVPPVEGQQWFRKVGTRAAQAISKVVMAGVRAERPRLAFGSVAPTVVRVPRTEEVLQAGGSVAEAQRVLASEISPINDLRSTMFYRRRVALNLLARFWADTSTR